MAKFKLNSGQSKKIKDIFKGNKTKESSISPSDKVAYKLTNQELSFLLQDNLGTNKTDFKCSNGEACKQPPISNLLGILFTFNYNYFNNLVRIEIHQMYFNDDESDPFIVYPSLKDSPIQFPSNWISLSTDRKYKIIDNIDSQSGENTHYSAETLQNLTLNEHLKALVINLDCMDKDKVDFVFFSVDQLEFMTKIYKNVIISGCQINYGKKLGHPTGPSKIAEKPIFTLKIEGDEFEDGIIPTGKAPADNQSPGPSPGVVYGHPCPPIWQTISILTSSILKIKPDYPLSSITNLSEYWMKAVKAQLPNVQENNDQS